MTEFFMEVIPCFPNTIFILDLKENFFNFKEKLKNNYEMIPIDQIDSKWSFMSKSLNVLDDFPNEKNILMNYFNFVKDKILFYEETNFEITTSWITKTCSKSFSHFHNHKNCMFSSVFYFDNEYDDSGFIEFKKSDKNSDSFLIIPSEVNMYNSDEFKIHPIKNRLIIFPSFLPHRINSVNSSKNRYSLAFNLFPVGKIGFRD